MIRSLVARLTLLEQATVVAAVLGFALVSLLVTREVLRRERQVFVSGVAGRLAKSFDDELTENPDPDSAAAGVIEDAVEAGVHAEIHDARGRFMASTEPIAGGSAADTEPRTTPRERDGPSARSLSKGGVRITTWTSDAPANAMLGALGKALIITALPILLASILLARSLVSRALRPLSEMAVRAAGFSADRKPRSLGPSVGLEEIDRLVHSFDQLLVRLDDAMSAERRLTADASHELRTPLTALGGELDMLLERLPPGGPEARGVERAGRQVRAMRELVEAILLLHRSGEAAAGGPGAEALNLCDLARESTAEAVARDPERRGDVRIDAPDELLVSGEPGLLGSAVRNLIDNALKFTRAGQPVEVRVAGGASDVAMTVDDAGSGVAEDERERIFDPFYRGARAGEGRKPSGFGLGLPILRRVARAHGGDVQVSSSPLGGARFVLSLPRRPT